MAEDDEIDYDNNDYEQDLNLIKGESKNTYDELNYDEDYNDENILTNKITENGEQFLEEDELVKEREGLIKKTMETLSFERDQSILVMLYYEWNSEKLIDWFDDIERNPIKAGLKIAPELKNKLKGDETCCMICYEEKTDDENFFSLSCGHQFCKDCWKEYLLEQIKNPLSCLLAKCPQSGCNCIIYEKLYEKFIGDDKEILGRLKKIILKNFINNNKDIKQCPNPHCRYYVKTDNHSDREIKCICGASYCFKCSRESHRPCSCEIVEKWMEKFKTDSSDELWIKANTKECPHCHKRIERSHGCNYMLCDSKAGGCGHAFCYVCETDWAKHSQDHFNCNKYTDAVKKKEANAKSIKERLVRYDFYLTRFMNLKKACDDCDNKFRKELEEKMNLIYVTHNIPVTELSFIGEALNTVIESKKSLKNTYIFGYYMKNDKKEIFEYKQGLLEFNTEKLHKYLIDNSINDMIELEEFTKFQSVFNALKNNILNLISCINKYRSSLLEEIENTFIGEIDYTIVYEKY